MAPKTPAKTEQVTKVELPAWVDSASQANYNLAAQLGSQTVPVYQGNRVGEMSGSTTNALEALKKAALGSTNNFADIASGKVSLANTDLSPYLNPYTNEVVDKSLADADKSRVQALMGNSDAAIKAGAFGGSRHGVTDAVTNAEALQDQGLLASQLRSAGFTQAQSAAQGDIANRITGAQGYSDATSKAIAELLGIGSQEQSTAQAKIDADMAKFNEPRQNQIDNLNLRLSALGMSPYGKTETANKTSSAGSSGTDFGQLGMGIFSLLLGLSEDDTKTDKEKVGKVPGTDLDLWAYRYKKDPKTYPKVVGVMASDVEKKMPEAVHRIDDKRVINYGLIAKAMANG